MYLGTLVGCLIASAALLESWYWSVATACPIRLFMTRQTADEWLRFFEHDATAIRTGLRVVSLSCAVGLVPVLARRTIRILEPRAPTETTEQLGSTSISSDVSDPEFDAFFKAVRQLLPSIKPVRHCIIVAVIYVILCGAATLPFTKIGLDGDVRPEHVGIGVATVFVALTYRRMLGLFEPVQRSDQVSAKDQHGPA